MTRSAMRWVICGAFARHEPTWSRLLRNHHTIARVAFGNWCGGPCPRLTRLSPSMSVTWVSGLRTYGLAICRIIASGDGTFKLADE